ncbi:hypothetical protein NUSPORA_01726 [Nucleospora cyclopteri]
MAFFRVQFALLRHFLAVLFRQFLEASSENFMDGHLIKTRVYFEIELDWLFRSLFLFSLFILIIRAYFRG